jgi:hypothetical protein
MGRALVVGAAVTVAAGVVGSAIPAQAASTSGWRKVFSKHYGPSRAYSGFERVVATSAGNAWAIGDADESGITTGQNVAAHWNGKAWKAVGLPATAQGFVTDASASGPGNVWAVTVGGTALHYNGSKWTAKHFPGTGELTGVTALSSSNVWVFGGSGFTFGLGTWHFDGKSWKQWKTGNAVGLQQASAVSASSIWAIGGVQAPDSAIDHFAGKAWHVASAKALQGLQFISIKAFSDRNVWVTAFGNSTGVGYLLHYNGTRWTRVAEPKGIQIDTLASDGHGGLWLAGGVIGANKPYFVHRSAGGTWGANIAPGYVEGFTAIPGASGLWASGAVRLASGGANAVIWADGKV